MASSASVGIDGLVTYAAAAERLSRALRLYVGRGRLYSVKELARGTAMPADRIEAYLAGVGTEAHRHAKLADVLSLCAFLGPEFTSDLLGLAQQGAFSLPDPDGGDLARIAPEVAEASADLTTDALRGDNVVGIETAQTLIRAGKQLAASAVARSGQGDLFERRRRAL